MSSVKVQQRRFMHDLGGKDHRHRIGTDRPPVGKPIGQDVAAQTTELRRELDEVPCPTLSRLCGRTCGANRRWMSPSRPVIGRQCVIGDVDDIGIEGPVVDR